MSSSLPVGYEENGEGKKRIGEREEEIEGGRGREKERKGRRERGRGGRREGCREGGREGGKKRTKERMKEGKPLDRFQVSPLLSVRIHISSLCRLQIVLGCSPH